MDKIAPVIRKVIIIASGSISKTITIFFFRDRFVLFLIFDMAK